MTNLSEKAVQYAHEHQEHFLNNLKELVSIPSISTSPEHKADMQKTAQWLAEHLRQLGLEHVQIFPTAGHPVVYADWLKAGSDRPTILIYGHYDVQPVEPLELWKSEPFAPTQRGENLYARGASDMKGQVVATLSAVEAVMKQGALPVNIKFLIEGEEEIGSPSLGDFLEKNKDLLSCDVAVNPDAGMIAPDVPTIVYALRGLAYFELRVYGPEHDLHSGLFGGAVHNPAQAICELIAGMHDEQGRVTLPGFYDSVRAISDEERQELARLPMDEDFYRAQMGVLANLGRGRLYPA